MESLVLETTSRRMNNRKIIRSSQRGFTEGKTCLTNLINFCNDMTGLVDEGRAVSTWTSARPLTPSPARPSQMMFGLLMFGLDEQTARWVENWLNGWARRVAISGMKLPLNKNQEFTIMYLRLPLPFYSAFPVIS